MDGLTRISTKPNRSSNPWNGPPPPLSSSTFPAHAFHLTGFRSSALKTSPAQMKTTEMIVSKETSGGMLASAAGCGADRGTVLESCGRFVCKVEYS